MKNICFVLSLLPQICSASVTGRIVFYNVENLFDTQLSPNEYDPTFLPLLQKKADLLSRCRSIPHPYHRRRCYRLDWSEKALDQKLKALAAALLQKDPKGPDLIGLAEVENEAVLRLLIHKLPHPESYGSPILIPGHDPRGINVGLISRWPIEGKPSLLEIPGLPNTRGILTATFRRPSAKDLLRIFVFHFPSQRSPTADRQKALDFLKIQIHLVPKSISVLAMGDSNITSAEAKILLKDWRTSPQSSLSLPDRGTHLHDGKWSHLDWMLFQPGPKQNSRPHFNILNEKASLKTARGAPRRFDPETGLGASDHFPVRVELRSPK